MNKHKKFIKDAYEGKYGSICQDWKDTILEHYPEFKEEEFKVGDWIIGNDDFGDTELKGTQIGRIIKTRKGGFDVVGGFYDESHRKLTWGTQVRKATPNEIREHLIAEANRRGYRDGILIECIEGAVGTIGQFRQIRNFRYSESLDRLDAQFGNYSYTVYSKGQWAEIINTMTKKEAEEKLGCKIID